MGRLIAIHRDLSMKDDEPFYFEIDGDEGLGSSYHQTAQLALEQAKSCVQYELERSQKPFTAPKSSPA